MKKLFCLITAVFLVLTGCKSEEPAEHIRVFADSSLSNALSAAADEYTAENSVDIEIVDGSTSKLFERIKDGVDCDIFIPSSKDQINSLIKNKYLNAENVIPLLKNNIVLIKKYDKDTLVKDFDSVTEAKSISLAEESEPVGMFAREVFINLNVFKDVLKMNTKSCQDSPSVVNSIIEGESDVGVCFETDALAQADKVQIIASAPKESLNSEVLYSVAVLNTDNGAEPSDNVKKFAEYLDSPEAAQIFAGFDFGIYIN